MINFKLLCTLTCCLLISFSSTAAQYSGLGYYPYAYGGGMYGGYPGGGGGGYPGGGYPGGGYPGGGGYPSYGYYPQYPIYGGRTSFPCFISILCGGGYPSYGGYPYYQNSLSTAFASSSSSGGVATAHASTGGFFG